MNLNKSHILINISLRTNQAGLSSSLESPVALSSTPVTNLLLCGWTVSTTGNFICSLKGQSSKLSHNRCYRLQPFKWQLWVSNILSSYSLIQQRIQNLSLDQKCHLLCQSVTCFLNKLEHWSKESSHLYIYTPGPLHKGEEHGPALKDEKKNELQKSVLYLLMCLYHLAKEHLLKKY